MKFDQLRAIGHNIADSFADGNGFLVGHCVFWVFQEARRSKCGFIEVDFLAGKTLAGEPSTDLELGIALYGDELPAFCRRHGASSSVFRQLSARFYWDKRFSVTVEDQAGCRVTDEYAGVPGRRLKLLDQRGRIRRYRGVVQKPRPAPAPNN